VTLLHAIMQHSIWVQTSSLFDITYISNNIYMSEMKK